MAEPGAVAWQFERKGVLTVDRAVDEDRLTELVVEAGAEDLRDEGDHWVVTAEPTQLAAIRQALVDAGIEPLDAELQLLSTTSVPVEDEAEARRVLRLIEALDDLDDVQSVWSNFDIPDAVLAAVG